MNTLKIQENPGISLLEVILDTTWSLHLMVQMKQLNFRTMECLAHSPAVGEWKVYSQLEFY